MLQRSRAPQHQAHSQSRLHPVGVGVGSRRESGQRAAARQMGDR